MVFTLLLLVLSVTIKAQDLTGIWKGYFYEGAGALRQHYKYEVQIKQMPDKALKGVTYSYLNVVFFGKASLQGIFMDKAANVLIKENEMLEIRSASGKSGACAMTCYLTYHKEGKEETLEGTYTSESVQDKTPCGAGKVYLKRVTESDFYKEDFLTDAAKGRKGIKPGAEGNLLPKDNARLPAPLKPAPGIRKKPSDSTIAIVPPGRPLTEPARPVAPPAIRMVPVPQVLKERENKLEKTIVVHSPDITIRLYDNGEIDNDTVTVYHNNLAVVWKKRLSYEPLTITLHATDEDNRHELVMVADNMGTVPPNTAFMIVTSGDQRYELSLASDLKHSAKVVIEYKPQGQ